MSEEDVVPPVTRVRRARAGRFMTAKKCCKKPVKKCYKKPVKKCRKKPVKK